MTAEVRKIHPRTIYIDGGQKVKSGGVRTFVKICLILDFAVASYYYRLIFIFLLERRYHFVLTLQSTFNVLRFLLIRVFRLSRFENLQPLTIPNLFFFNCHRYIMYKISSLIYTSYGVFFPWANDCKTQSYIIALLIFIEYACTSYIL